MLKTLYRKYLSSFADHPLATDIQWERHNLFMTEVGSRMISAVIGAALVGAMFYKSAPMSSILIWFGGICFVGINSWLLIRYHKRHPEPEHSTRNLAYVRRWHWLNLYQAAIWGLLWALTPFLFFPDASNIQVLSVLMMVVVLSSTPSITMGCYPDIYITFLTPVFFSFGFLQDIYLLAGNYRCRFCSSVSRFQSGCWVIPSGPRARARFSAPWQIPGWIHRVAILAYLEMQLRFVGSGIAQFGDYLSSFHTLPFLNENFPIVCVGAQIMFVMVHDNQIAIT